MHAHTHICRVISLMRRQLLILNLVMIISIVIDIELYTKYIMYSNMLSCWHLHQNHPVQFLNHPSLVKLFIKQQLFSDHLNNLLTSDLCFFTIKNCCHLFPNQTCCHFDFWHLVFEHPAHCSIEFFV